MSPLCKTTLYCIIVLFLNSLIICDITDATSNTNHSNTSNTNNSPNINTIDSFNHEYKKKSDFLQHHIDKKQNKKPTTKNNANKNDSNSSDSDSGIEQEIKHLFSTNSYTIALYIPILLIFGLIFLKLALNNHMNNSSSNLLEKASCNNLNLNQKNNIYSNRIELKGSKSKIPEYAANYNNMSFNNNKMDKNNTNNNTSTEGVILDNEERDDFVRIITFLDSYTK